MKLVTRPKRLSKRAQREMAVGIASTLGVISQLPAPERRMAESSLRSVQQASSGRAPLQDSLASLG